MKMNFNNPVLLKEVKLRFRSPKSFTGILFYLIAVCIFVFGFIFVTMKINGTSYFKPSESFVLFTLLSYIQLGLVLFITPGLTAGTISTEREKQTLSILLTTSQSSFQIISGKLLSSIAFLLLLIVAALPIYSLVFLFGGISPKEFVIVFFYPFCYLTCNRECRCDVLNNHSKNNRIDDCYVWDDAFSNNNYRVFVLTRYAIDGFWTNGNECNTELHTLVIS